MRNWWESISVGCIVSAMFTILLIVLSSRRGGDDYTHTINVSGTLSTSGPAPTPGRLYICVLATGPDWNCAIVPTSHCLCACATMYAPVFRLRWKISLFSFRPCHGSPEYLHGSLNPTGVKTGRQSMKCAVRGSRSVSIRRHSSFGRWCLKLSG